MSNIDLEQLAQSQKANAQVMMTLVRTAFHGLEQLSALNLAASRELFNSSTSGAQQLLNVRSPEDLKDVAASVARPNVDKLLEYSRNLYELAANMQREITTVMEEQYNNVRHNASGLIEKTGLASPIGGEVFGAAMKQMMNASTTAFENISQMAKQMTDIVDTNVKAATSATAQAAAALTPKK
ncbi:MAG TPA: phasin family protein [Accumulibacter sp.]|uniref:phasin family protein n=1 Tax=Accumulibacter sp. TaxID=2053492 RepID=UPI002603A6E3|nr:phasin family protein [Accumulibacter sp.]MDS4056891.1 phasin family protein [Accumulibacter sp.]HMV04224.1 phasin family protein [Accumulibacter sp.]HMW62777.1 phasin family protein [Accumulibacter sp.]HMW79572.1 phasin family protein [Accumulibacter sp.]HMX67688.1 phasin family protein [Accumulibacter sp.]